MRELDRLRDAVARAKDLRDVRTVLDRVAEWQEAGYPPYEAEGVELPEGFRWIESSDRLRLSGPGSKTYGMARTSGACIWHDGAREEYSDGPFPSLDAAKDWCERRLFGPPKMVEPETTPDPYDLAPLPSDWACGYWDDLGGEWLGPESRDVSDGAAIWARSGIEGVAKPEGIHHAPKWLPIRDGAPVPWPEFWAGAMSHHNRMAATRAAGKTTPEQSPDGVTIPEGWVREGPWKRGGMRRAGVLDDFCGPVFSTGTGWLCWVKPA